MENVSWYDCTAFIKQLNDISGDIHFRLPTEAEWEYSCRAGTDTPFSFGGSITTDQVNFNGNHPYDGNTKGRCRKETVEVKLMPCNPWGLYEMHGNVWEWCSDWYNEYNPDDSIDPKGPGRGASRVLRGGSWVDLAWIVRSAFRDRYHPDWHDDSTGFRLARGY